MARLSLIVLIAFLLAPGTFVRSSVRIGMDDAVVAAKELAITDEIESGISGELELSRIWSLSSPHQFFGGFSALTIGPDRRLIAASDRGWAMNLPMAGDDLQTDAAFFGNFAAPKQGKDDLIDVEALTFDTASGNLWVAYENRNQIERLAGPIGKDLSSKDRQRVAPDAMRDWSPNAGPETLVRLDDGRFVVLSEGRGSGSLSDNPALLFPADPLEQAEAIQFRFAPPQGYSPVDATQLPDGRVLILLRAVQVAAPARWRSAIAIAHPAEIASDKVWSGDVVARFDRGLLAENFEGIAYLPAIGGGASTGFIMVISDDNFSVFQQNLLVQLEWPAEL